MDGKTTYDFKDADGHVANRQIETAEDAVFS